VLQALQKPLQNVEGDLKGLINYLSAEKLMPLLFACCSEGRPPIDGAGNSCQASRDAQEYQRCTHTKLSVYISSNGAFGLHLKHIESATTREVPVERPTAPPNRFYKLKYVL
jgi:hypothetical protein